MDQELTDWRDTGGAQQGGLVVKAVLALSQLIAFAVIAGISRGEACDQPLRIYLILSATRIGISFPRASRSPVRRSSRAC